MFHISALIVTVTKTGIETTMMIEANTVAVMVAARVTTKRKLQFVYQGALALPSAKFPC
jgi:hypothetical protein